MRHGRPLVPCTTPVEGNGLVGMFTKFVSTEKLVGVCQVECDLVSWRFQSCFEANGHRSSQEYVHANARVRRRSARKDLLRFADSFKPEDRMTDFDILLAGRLLRSQELSLVAPGVAPDRAFDNLLTTAIMCLAW
jgi:hypothetical protein